MPATRKDALRFLGTQWSSLTQNKVVGIAAEVEFQNYLAASGIHYLPGGWILTPGDNSIAKVPTQARVALIPRAASFPWHPITTGAATHAEISAYHYFRQVGIKVYFVQPVATDVRQFTVPTRTKGRTKACYPRPYDLEFQDMLPSGPAAIPFATAFADFPRRSTGKGLRCYRTKLKDSEPPWTAPSIVSQLFWFEYCRYFVHSQVKVSSNDIDMFLIGKSGASYPTEIKTKVAADDKALGKWFGIDVGTFAKLAFFTASSMNMDALYVVKEVDEHRAQRDWLGIRFKNLVQACSWVMQAGGTGMTGGSTAILKVPRDAMTPLALLLPTL
jgi:hypothetical protein